MKIDVTNFILLGKRLTGSVLKLFFQDINDNQKQKVLELENVIAFIDSITTERFQDIVIDEAGVYGADISMRLQQPEVNEYSEVLIIANSDCVYRGLAKKVCWRDFESSDFNY